MIHMIQKTERKRGKAYKNVVLEEIYTTLNELFPEDYVQVEFDKHFPSEDHQQFVLCVQNELVRAEMPARIYCTYSPNYILPKLGEMENPYKWRIAVFSAGKTFKSALITYFKGEVRRREEQIKIIQNILSKENNNV